MRKYIKKMVVFTILAGMLTTTSVQAVGALPTNESDYNIVVPSESFNEIFGHENIVPASGDDGIDYNYSINMSNNNQGTASLDFTITAFGQSYPISVSGNVACIELTSDTLIRGPLTGIQTIQGTDYIVDVGFTKSVSQNKISAGVTITSADYMENEDALQTMFYFGDFVMSDNLMNEYQKYVNNDNFDDVVDKSQSTTSVVPMSIINKGSATGSLIKSGFGEGSYNGSGTGQRLQVKVDTSRNEILCALTSYAKNIKQSDFVTGTLIDASVSAYQIGARQISGSAYIDQMDGVKDTGYSSNLKNLFYSIIEDIASHWIPTSTLMSLFENVGGSVKTLDDASHSYMHVAMDSSERVTFDSQPFAFGFLIDADGGKTGTYNVYSYLTYGIDMLEAWFEVRTTTATVTNVYVY